MLLPQHLWGGGVDGQSGVVLIQATRQLVLPSEIPNSLEGPSLLVAPVLSVPAHRSMRSSLLGRLREYGDS
jgi:hypothetical protein